MLINEMTRAEMECEILAENILPCSTAEELSRIQAMSDEEMRAALQAWVEAGSEV